MLSERPGRRGQGDHAPSTTSRRNARPVAARGALEAFEWTIAVDAFDALLGVDVAGADRAAVARVEALDAGVRLGVADGVGRIEGDAGGVGRGSPAQPVGPPLEVPVVGAIGLRRNQGPPRSITPALVPGFAGVGLRRSFRRRGDRAQGLRRAAMRVLAPGTFGGLRAGPGALPSPRSPHAPRSEPRARGPRRRFGGDAPSQEMRAGSPREDDVSSIVNAAIRPRASARTSVRRSLTVWNF